MSGQRPAIQAAHNTPEQVALSLFHIIARVEGKSLDWNGTDREWILNTYAECIRTIREPQTRSGGAGSAMHQRQPYRLKV